MKPIFVQYCAKDALEDTLNLGPWEELAYRRLVDMILTSNDRLLDDDKKLAWSTKAGSRWPKIKAVLLEIGMIETVDGRISTAKCRSELEKTAKRIEQKSEAGKASAQSRNSLKNNDTASTDVGCPVDSSVLTEPQPTNEPVNQESKKEDSPLPPSGGGDGELFADLPTVPAKPEQTKRKPSVRYTDSQLKPFLAQFEAAYPSSDETQIFDVAFRTIKRMVNNAKSPAEPEALVAAAARYNQAESAKGNVGTHWIMKPNNWLNNGEWKKYDGVHRLPTRNNRHQQNEHRKPFRAGIPG